jgi:O-antigen/teichoic acid export membrane protein
MSNMSNKALEKLTWATIYGGLILLMVGLWSLEGQPVVGGVLAWIGGGLVGVGAALIWWRSRRGEEPSAVDKASE